jgi:hypothetical protein
MYSVRESYTTNKRHYIIRLNYAGHESFTPRWSIESQRRTVSVGVAMLCQVGLVRVIVTAGVIEAQVGVLVFIKLLVIMSIYTHDGLTSDTGIDTFSQFETCLYNLHVYYVFIE